MRKNIFSFFAGAGLPGLVFLLTRCGSSSVPPQSFTQVERLGRPAINEGLVLTNDNLNLFNTVAPSSDLTPAAQGPIGEAVTVLTLINKVAAASALNPPSVANVQGGFLPDVLRIDTSLVISASVNAPSYNQAVNDNLTKPILLVGGRKLTDNVINITLGYLFNSSPLDTAANPAYDNGTTYYGLGASGCPGANGTNPAAPGHHCLHGQTVPYGTATFPFLAAAN